MNEVVTVSAGSKSFSAGGGAPKVEALREVSLAVRAGEFIAVVGPSGCGKSTLLNILGLAERPDTGDVLIMGESTRECSERARERLRRSSIGYVFQHFNLLSTLTVLENVMVPLVLNGRARDDAAAHAESLLANLKLSHRLSALPFSLSGGESQRVAIARAVAHGPKLILADEPTGSLDSHSGEVVLDLLKEYVDLGISVVMATHSEAALARCSRTLHMKDGALVEG
jgi:putative ABC transport system ATP-binding protein